MEYKLNEELIDLLINERKWKEHKMKIRKKEKKRK